MNNPTRYFRCAYPDSYYEVRGDSVTYFAPHVPDGFPSQWPLSDLVRCAASRPATDCEITAEQMGKVRALLLERVEEARKRHEAGASLAATTFR